MKLFSRTAGADHGSSVDMIQSLTLTSRTSLTSGRTHSNTLEAYGWTDSADAGVLLPLPVRSDNGPGRKDLVVSNMPTSIDLHS